MQKDLTNLLSKPMDRRDFLKHVGMGFVALTGFATIIKTMNETSAPRRVSNGYGASSYGGGSTAYRR